MDIDDFEIGDRVRLIHIEYPTTMRCIGDTAVVIKNFSNYNNEIGVVFDEQSSPFVKRKHISYYMPSSFEKI